MKITGAQVFEARGSFVCRDIFTDGPLLSDHDGGGAAIDAAGCYAIPGLTDLHFHGCKGYDFSDGDAEGLAVMAEYELSRGVTQICPAGMTLLEDQLVRICRVAGGHRAAKKGGAALCGVNLEGPFLSMEKKGAQNGDWLQPP
ncbi:MAG: N-acetylglucosamine-6-phosphate deacetylase, partial [Pseudoflavonifractor sp.]